MVKAIKAIALYAFGLVLFLYCWIAEQRHAVRHAYWDSLGSAHDHVKRLYAKDADNG